MVLRPYVLGVLALGVIVTPMLNAARGSLLVPMIFHFQINGPAWPEAQPWENYLFAILAVLIVVANRRTMMHRGTGVTEVVLPGFRTLGPRSRPIVDQRS